MVWRKPQWNGALFSQLRENEGWTQRALAEQVSGLVGKSVSPPTVHNWENGTEPPSYAHLRAIARTLQVPVERFFETQAV